MPTPPRDNQRPARRDANTPGRPDPYYKDPYYPDPRWLRPDQTPPVRSAPQPQREPDPTPQPPEGVRDRRGPLTAAAVVFALGFLLTMAFSSAYQHPAQRMIGPALIIASIVIAIGSFTNAPASPPGDDTPGDA